MVGAEGQEHDVADAVAISSVGASDRAQSECFYIEGNGPGKACDVEHDVTECSSVWEGLVHDYSSRMPVSAMTFFQRARSAFRCASHSAGELATMVPPPLATCSRNDALFTAFAAAAASFSTIATGVPAGTTKPAQAVTS